MEPENSDTIFNQNKPAENNQTPTTPEPAQESVKSSLPAELEGLVGEGKKYATVEAALKSVPHAQSYIEEQKSKIAELEAELMKRKSAEEVLNELRQKKEDGEPAPTQPTSIDPLEIKKLVGEELTALERQKLFSNNLQSVDMKLKESFGDRTAEVYKAKMDELGLTNDQLMNMAGSSPKAFLKLFDLNKEQSTPKTVKGSINTDTLPNIKKHDEPVYVLSGASTDQLVSAWRRHAVKEN